MKFVTVWKRGGCKVVYGYCFNYFTYFGNSTFLLIGCSQGRGISLEDVWRASEANT